MGLSLIVGPPNSGRAGEVRSRLLQNLERDPVLVVPTADDAARFEAELCEAGGGRSILGASTLTFRRLFEELAGTAGIDTTLSLSQPQRLALVRAAARATPLRVLARSAGRPGFGAALDLLIVELQAALVAPEDLGAAVEALEDPALELELAALYRTYLDLREQGGRSDDGAIASSLLEAMDDGPPPSWQGRPVFLYGFDDLSRVQLELVARLAEQCEVTVAVNYEDRRALQARAGLLADLVEALGADREPSLSHEGGYTRSDVLRHLDRNLFEAGAPSVPPDDGLVLLECAGDLGEAEAIGGEIAGLLAGGALPEEVAIVVRHPSTRGPLLGRVLERLEVPAAVEADVPLGRTAVGRALAALCRAALPQGSAEDLLAYLRADPSVRPGAADWVERRVRRGLASSATEAVASWESPPRHWARLRDQTSAADRLRALGRIAVAVAESPHRERAPLSGERADGAAGTPFDPVEMRAARVASELLEELVEVGELPGCEQPDLADAAEAIEAASVPLWRGSTEGRVRILSPYRIRAGRARYLFCASLQEGEFPGSAAISPLLTEERRRAIGIRALRRQEPADEERYLFHTCVSRPTDRLYLSWRASTEDGAPSARSPFVDEVLDLVEPDPAAAERHLKRPRGLERTAFAPDEAPTSRELARSLAALGPRADLDALDLADEVRADVGAMLAAVPPPGAKPGPLRSPVVLAELRAREAVSANSLEGWVECSYRWFVSHELTPQRLEPEADPLWLGSVVHNALERLYREAPGTDSIPRQGDVASWQRRLGELLAEEATDEDGRAPAGDRALALARARAQAERFLEEEAASETELRPDPRLLELAFGFEGEDDPGALRLGDVGLRGRIDRVDVGPDGQGAVVRDYKTGRRVTGARAFEEEGKLQIQLYMRLVRERLGLDVVGGLYQPLGARGRARRPRGLVVKEDERLDDLNLVNRDRLEREDFDAELDRAVALGIEKATRMLGGKITRDPIGGTCPAYCSYHPICRIERSLGPTGENGNGDE